MRSVIFALLLSASPALAATDCGVYHNSDAVVTFGEPYEDEATISSPLGQSVCSLDTDEQSLTPSETFDCNGIVEKATFWPASGNVMWPAVMHFRDRDWNLACD